MQTFDNFLFYLFLFLFNKVGTMKSRRKNSTIFCFQFRISTKKKKKMMSRFFCCWWVTFLMLIGKRGSIPEWGGGICQEDRTTEGGGGKEQQKRRGGFRSKEAIKNISCFSEMQLNGQDETMRSNNHKYSPEI